MITERMNPAALLSCIIALTVTLTQTACGNTQLGDPEAPAPILILQLPDKIPEPGTPDYDVLIRFDDHHDNVYALVSGGSSQISNGKIRINFLAGERGQAKIAVYPHQRNGCAQYVGYAAANIDRDGVLPVSQISVFTRQAMETCLLDVDHRTSDNLRVGTVVSTAFSGGSDPQINCGNECFAHVPKGSTVTLQAIGTQVYVFSYWEVASLPAKSPIVINGPTSVVARFSSVACTPGAYCQDDFSISNSRIEDVTTRDIFGFGSNDVWAVGLDVSQRGVIMHYAQRKWQGVTSDSSGIDLPPLRGVWGDPASGTVWVAGGDVTGGALFTCKTDLAGKPQCKRELFAIAGMSSTVTFTGISGFGSVIWLMDNREVYGCSKSVVGGMNIFNALGPSTMIYGLAALDATTVAVVGQSGIAYKCGVGTACNALPNICGSGATPVPSYYSVASKSGELLAGGDAGNLCRNNGSVWASETPSAASTVQVRDVTIAGGKAWAVGSGGYVESWPFGNRPGNVFTPPKSTSKDLYAVWSAGNDTWFGGTGVLLHYQ